MKILLMAVHSLGFQEFSEFRVEIEIHASKYFTSKQTDKLYVTQIWDVKKI